MPLVDLRGKRNSLSWGVSLVDRPTSDRDGVKSLGPTPSPIYPGEVHGRATTMEWFAK